MLCFTDCSMDDHDEEKRRQQNLIVIGKSEAEAAGIRRLRSTYCIIEANYWQTEASRVFSATAGLLVLIVLSRLDKEAYISDEMLPLKRGRGVTHNFICVPAFVGYASCWRTFFLQFLVLWHYEFVTGRICGHCVHPRGFTRETVGEPV